MESGRLQPDVIRAKLRAAEQLRNAERGRINQLRHDLLAFHPKYRRFVLTTWALMVFLAIGLIIGVALEGPGLIATGIICGVPICVIRRHEHVAMVSALQSELRPRFEVLDGEQRASDHVFALARCEYDQSCELCLTYPPDWKNRRDEALARDGYRCTQCRWPEGAKRRSRELHVHHVVAISESGTHVLSNLVTLCHICHRKVDSKHRIVRKSSRPKFH
jgi:hypothetical protein